MSDSSDNEDLSRFKEAVDTSFIELFDKSKNTQRKEIRTPKSERYLEIASHYNDVKVPEAMQKKIGAKLSEIINKNIEFVDIQENGVRKRKIKGGVKLFKTSEGFLSSEDAKDTYTQVHNSESKKIKRKRRLIEDETDNLTEKEKLKAVAVTGEYIMSKKEIKFWKSRRKEVLLKYKSNGKSNVLTAVE